MCSKSSTMMRLRLMRVLLVLRVQMKLTSAFGAFLDPVADKLMVSTVLILLAVRIRAWVPLPRTHTCVRKATMQRLRQLLDGPKLDLGVDERCAC